ncbi:MOSC domain-containing protein [Streptomyces sp. H27-D2]|uniref:MOSC domain-containing protein n=1 Tax=Streptomyces sp. H27-D2 TaxID=3046304 RepID=UPI002DBB38BD|nr:MOSC domain-containing protein [Streptomyces sp. H27-D2]MEC4019431.1 MOSC domain-containing protein [Streptomyces sp. H27-D2]
MTVGVLSSIHLAPTAGARMVAVDSARAVGARGLEGDRYFTSGPGPRPRFSGVGRASGSCDITLIEAEALEALALDTGVALLPGEARRNLVCRGVRLGPLVGREFRVGAVTLRGIARSEPCLHLEQLTRPGVLRGLIHRGGLRAEIVTDGLIRVADPVSTASG